MLAVPVALVTLIAGCGSGIVTMTDAPSDCSTGTVASSAEELSDALETVASGETIVLADGRYTGHFELSDVSDITLCGGREAILDGGGTEDGYTLHLENVSGSLVEGFGIVSGQKGLMLDSSSDNTISGLSISGTGDEALHVRAASSDNLIENNEISDTGRSTPRFGEGIYIGTAESNWCSITACDPDESNGNRVVGNTISGTTAENIDIKEGTEGGEISSNTLDGSASVESDSLIDVKGSAWTVTGNTGANATTDGIQVHVIDEGPGGRNTFADNAFDVASDGYAINLVGAARYADNMLACSNSATVDGSPAPDRVSDSECGSP